MGCMTVREQIKCHAANLCDKIRWNIDDDGNALKPLCDYLYKKGLGWKITDDCYAFLDKCVSDGKTIRAVETRWRKLFESICLRMGINGKSADVLWESMCLGNWEKLHRTEEDESRTVDEWFDKFYMDMLYCSDRWSMDRLMRVHWAFRQWKKEVSKTCDDM